jgi:cytochrome oxidase Cu insertion factor (SCO1/SenC/PrrC family)
MPTMLPATRHSAWLLVALALTIGACEREPAVDVSNLEPVGFGGDFSLTAHDGRPFRLQDLRGKAVLMFFGYTSCPDMCPLTMSRIASARDQLGGDASRVATVFVSVDPNRDTPDVLKEYVASWAMPVTALTGSDEEIAKVADTYHVQYQIVPASPHYLMNHTTAIFLIDPQGRLRGLFAYNEKPETLAAVLRAVLNEN